jgi:hypothetical protein
LGFNNAVVVTAERFVALTFDRNPDHEPSTAGVPVLHAPASFSHCKSFVLVNSDTSADMLSGVVGAA